MKEGMSLCSAGHRACKGRLLLVVLANPKAHDPAMPTELGSRAAAPLKEVMGGHNRIGGELKDCG